MSASKETPLGRPCGVSKLSIVSYTNHSPFLVKIDKNEECGDGGDESDDQKDCGEGGKHAHSDQEQDGSDEVKPPARHAKTAMGVVRGGNNK